MPRHLAWNGCKESTTRYSSRASRSVCLLRIAGTHTVTRKHLEDALDALSGALDTLRNGKGIPNLQ